METMTHKQIAETSTWELEVRRMEARGYHLEEDRGQNGAYARKWKGKHWMWVK